MADTMGGEIQGLGEVLGKLKALENTPRQKTTRFALRKAANVVRDAAKAGASRIDDPATANSIAENVVVRADTRHLRTTGELKFSVGVRGGSTSKRKNSSNPGGDTYYWRFLEFGTEHMAAQPFMRPAMEESIAPATAEFVKQFDKAIVRAIRRANKAKATR
ncbi:HK97-gp10 family putative phage morphogenesis protein [Halomonas rhizosphaerae]|uniref:HK97 gp10 family phage protein n=1 Tax=Halomonas rhizosphaerae TaxID=3043296 RepID=A0ABT6V0Y0_9GAMM|nr:HK97-gp10 family putative phage morphogenesis protein [Halomonas rhizosphaerae]MDI5890602.1 HK97 gp10 family phage protein [Halomonas rhizosphaerae]